MLVAVKLSHQVTVENSIAVDSTSIEAQPEDVVIGVVGLHHLGYGCACGIVVGNDLFQRYAVSGQQVQLTLELINRHVLRSVEQADVGFGALKILRLRWIYLVGEYASNMPKEVVVKEGVNGD
ncbi:unnamed protein product [Cylicocyclus nassatus]|uniref:Uncharacterized protein n=1 Tax=Cylicocyclus nassatus TaxID=53992 RepID=A0AA36M8X4_CYLNA|nr:unnamed protein product [Cylicocyclus nassatus]